MSKEREERILHKMTRSFFLTHKKVFVKEGENAHRHSRYLKTLVKKKSLDDVIAFFSSDKVDLVRSFSLSLSLSLQFFTFNTPDSAVTPFSDSIHPAGLAKARVCWRCI